MARIVQQGVITTSGVSFENEPIVRSDGSGEIMQWQPSDAGADGIYIVEGGSAGDPARLGIGVAAPGSPLAIKDIVDNSNESGIRLLRSANSDCAFINMRGGAFNINTRNNAANAGLPFKVKMHGTEVFAIDTSGNVGIGDSPSTLLHIKSANPVIRLEDSDPDGIYAEVDGAGGDLILSADGGNGDADSQIKFKVDNSIKAIIDANGQVTIKSDATNDTPGRLNLWATDTSIVTDDTIGALYGQGSDNAASPPLDGAKIEFNADANWDGGSSNYQPTRIDFFTQDNSGTNTLTTPRLTIDSSGDISIAGAADPYSLSGDGAVNQLSVHATGTNKSASLNLASTGTGWNGVSLGNETIRRAFVGTLNGSHLVFYTNNSNSGTTVTERLRIASDGNIEQHTDSNGIVKFGVKNESTGTAARAMVNVLSDSGNLDLSMNGSNYTGVAGWADSGTISTGSGASGGLKMNAVVGGLALQTNQTTRLSIANSTGNITTTLSSANTNTAGVALKLDHTTSGSSAVGFGTLIRFDGERTGSTSDGMGTLGFVADSMSASRVDGAFVVNTGLDGTYTERMRITSTGEIKTGSTPGSAHADANDLIIGNGSSTNAGITLNTPSAGGYLYFADGNSGDDLYRGFIKYVHSGNAMEFGTDAVSRLTISSTGAVSISSGTLTVGSLNIGHGLGGDVNSVAIGNDALDATTAHCLHNTAVGNNALSGLNSSASSNDAGDFNTSVGSNSSSSMTTGHSNTAVGRNALGTDDGVRNVSIGMGSLDANCANDNSALGYNALAAFTGSNAVAVGSQAADAATDAANLTAVGTDALSACTEGDHNTAVGMSALALTTTGEENVAIGKGAGYSVTGDRNVIVGKDAAYYATSVTDTIAIGAIAFRGDGATAPTGNYNIAIGSYALDAATTAANNVVIGYQAATSIDEQSDNVAIGYKSLKTETSSGGSVAIGSEALETQNVSNANNVAVGRLAGHLLTTGTDGVYIGHSAAGGATLTGDDNTVVGKSAGYDLTSGYRNVLIGSGAGQNVTDNFSNIAIGHNALLAANTGENYNVAIGGNALYSETSGADYCVAVGYNAMIGQNANVVNTSVGSSALFHNKSGGNSVALGMSAGYANVDSYNTWIGHQAGAHTGHAAANTTLGYRTYFSSTFTNGTCDLNGSTTVTCDSNTDIQVGQAVTGSGIPYGNYVTAVNDSTGVTSFTLSIAATTTANNQTLTFYRGTGDSNTCIGYTAGEDLTTGSENVLIGRGAGKEMTNNASNVAIGYLALDAANGSESYNVAIGSGALSAETSGADYCVAIGKDALNLQNGSVKNTAIGGLAGDAITSGTGNTAVGYVACSAAAGNYNTAIGHAAYAKGTGANNVVIGASAGSSVDNTGTAFSGNDNVVIGMVAGYDLTDGPGNVLIGKSAGANMTTGDNNVVIGYQAADAMTGESNYNVAIGSDALGAEASGADGCIAIGTNALLSQNDASAVNMAIGKSAGDAITDGSKNVLIGHQAGSALTTADESVALGYQALAAATGGHNTAIGSQALDAVVAGTHNTAVGSNAMGQADGGESKNTAIGQAALFALNNDSADSNVAVGFEAGRYYETDETATPGSATPDGNNTEGAESIFIGYDTRSAEADRSNEIVIGHTAVSNGSNTITLGNDTTASIHCADTSISALSDRRIKRDIKDTNVGLSFVDKLTAVEYKRLNPADWPEEIRSHRYRVEEHQELVTPAVEAADAVYEDVVVVEARAAVEEVTETIEHPAQEAVYEDVIIPAVEELKEERVTQHAREEETEERVVQEAQEEITEERIVQEAREEIKGERHKHDEKEVTEEVERVEMVKGEGNNYIRKVTTETVTRIERTPLYVDHPVVNEDGTPCLNIISPAVEAKEAVTREVPAVTEEREIPAVTEERQTVDENGDGVVDEDGNAVMETVVIEPAKTETVEVEPARTEIVEPAVEAKAAVTEQVIHQCPVREEYVIQEAQEEKRETVVVQEAREEKRETVVVQEAQEEVREMVVVREAEPERTERRLVSPAVPARTEVRVITPAEPAVEEVKERRLVSPAVEAQEAVYKTVTVPADERPDDDDTVRLGLVAQDVQTAMADAGVEFDLVTKGANGKLAVKYSNLVIPLLKAVQELSAEVKALKG